MLTLGINIVWWQPTLGYFFKKWWARIRLIVFKPTKTIHLIPILKCWILFGKSSLINLIKTKNLRYILVQKNNLKKSAHFWANFVKTYLIAMTCEFHLGFITKFSEELFLLELPLCWHRPSAPNTSGPWESQCSVPTTAALRMLRITTAVWRRGKLLLPARPRGSLLPTDSILPSEFRLHLPLLAQTE